VRLGLRSASTALLVLLACGPYAEVGEKLDVAMTFTTAETFIAAPGTEVRLLVLGHDGSGSASGFALSSLELPQAAGVSGRTLEGTWSETPSELTLQASLDYEMPDERGEGLLDRAGSVRNSVDETIPLSAVRSGDTLTLTGNTDWAGDYVLLTDALGTLGTATAGDAACAFLVANLAVMTSEVRIIGFGGPGMLQYSSPFTYVGTLSGGVRVALAGGLFSPVTTITYSDFSDFSGVSIDGDQITYANSGGNGHLQGTVNFTFSPTLSGAPAPQVTGSIGYDAIEISNGYVSGGDYAVSMAGGGTTSVDPVSAPVETVASCLGLP
jgi:hypothetical protein